jgi:hypothetical protein
LRDRFPCRLKLEHIPKRLVTESKIWLEKATLTAVTMKTVSRDALELQRKLERVNKLSMHKPKKTNHGKVRPKPQQKPVIKGKCYRYGEITEPIHVNMQTRSVDTVIK